MIRHVNAELTGRLYNLLKEFPEKAVRISALLKAYGTDAPFFRVWLQNDRDSIIARLDNTFFLCAADNADYEEIAFFLQFNPYFRFLTGETHSIKETGNELTIAFTLKNDNILCHNGDIFPAINAVINDKPDLNAVYEIISSQSQIPGRFSPWYTDMNHRIRHRCARAYLIMENGRPVCTGLISAESNEAGLISGITTKPEHCGKGYASALVARACADLILCGKSPVLECEDFLLPFYIKRGFKQIGNVSVLKVE